MVLRRVSTTEALNAPIGTTMLVRSKDVNDGQVHWIRVTGTPVLKKNGLRPQTVQWLASLEDKKIMDKEEGDVVILMLIN